MTSAWLAPCSQATLHRLPCTLGIGARCRPGHPLPLRPADAGSGQTATTNGWVPTCSTVHRAKARASPVTHPLLFWQHWCYQHGLGISVPAYLQWQALVPLTRSGWARHLSIVIPGLGAGSEFCSHKEHTFLWVYLSDFTVSSMTGIVIPASLVWWAVGTHLLTQGRWAPACFSSPGWRFSPLFGSQERCLTARIFSLPGIRASADVMGIYWSLTGKGVWPFQRSWTQAVKHTLCIFEINEASFTCDTCGWIFGSADHLWLLPHSLRTCWHAELWKIRPRSPVQKACWCVGYQMCKIIFTLLLNNNKRMSHNYFLRKLKF